MTPGRFLEIEGAQNEGGLHKAEAVFVLILPFVGEQGGFACEGLPTGTSTKFDRRGTRVELPPQAADRDGRGRDHWVDVEPVGFDATDRGRHGGLCIRGAVKRETGQRLQFGR